MTTPVHARGGCFASGTHILTTRGDITIEQLHVGDPVVGLNLENQQLETEHIGDIQVVEAPDYYVINDSITVTGFHPFYVQQEAGLRLVLVEDLSVGDQLIGEGEFSPIVRSIRHYEEPITVYNLLSVTPHHNFFAEGVLVHNKGGGGGGGRGGGGSGGYGGGGYGSSAPFTLKTISGLLIPFLILTASLLPVILWREIYNGVRFFGKDFSEDAGLIAFTQQVNPNFCNRYAAICSEDNEGWESHSLLQEIDTVAYSEVVEKVSLIDQVSQIFSRYQNDWTKKNFDAMADYTMPSFHEQQQSLFHKEFRDNFDIVYLPKIKDLVPIRAQQSDTDFVITVQLVTAAINFEVSSKGRVLSGKPESRTFTEYWDVAVDAQKTCRLLSIRSKHSG
ncbi:MAG: polymorphic toxin-type HINT domain-containing protein [Cyanobacteria bacterium J06598_3]